MMMKRQFSERIGVGSQPMAIQLHSMDAPLRNSLWNALHASYLSKYNQRSGPDWKPYPYADSLDKLMELIWCRIFKKPLDEIPVQWNERVRLVKQFILTCSWEAAYDLVEFVPNAYQGYSDDILNRTFINQCNTYLEKERSGYRFINNKLAPINEDGQLAAVQASRQMTIQGARMHIECALALLSDRTTPDYAAVVRESLLAVAAVCFELTGTPSVDAALKKLEERQPLATPFLHPISQALQFTISPEGTIEHPLLMPGAPLGLAEARFILVTCSAFIEFVDTKTVKTD